MKGKSFKPSPWSLQLCRVIGVFLFAILAIFSSQATTVQSHLLQNSEVFLAGRATGYQGINDQPQSINPDWKHLGITWRASVASDGTEGNSYVAQDSAISADGRYVVFGSRAWSLVPGDEQYGYEDVFIHDNQTGVTERISVSSSGVPGNKDSFYGVDISADGRYVVFTTEASNLVSNDTNNKWDIFLRDRQMNTTVRVSVSSTGSQSNGNSWLPRISEDGDTVVYTSEATNLISSDSNNRWDIFVFNRLNGQTERVSISTSGVQANGDSGDNKTPAISADGRYIAFTSEASNLVTGDTNSFCDMNGDGTANENCPDVFVRDRTNGTTERVSLNNSGEQGNNYSMLPSISNDGRYVAFYSMANNLVDNDTNTCLTLYYSMGPCPDVFVRDRQAGTTVRVSVSSSGGQGTVDPIYYFKPPAISGDGRYVAFESADTTLASGATNGYSQILIHDRQTHETTLVSANTYGWQGNEWSNCPPDLSTNGRYVTFYSSASDLVTDDANDLADIFVRDREEWTYAVAGTVRDELNHPLANITVGYGTKTGQSKATDNNGEYELYYMAPGTYAIKTWAIFGYISVPSVREITVPPTTINVDFIIQPATNFMLLPLVNK
jgi:hypothetical protein